MNAMMSSMDFGAGSTVNVASAVVALPTLSVTVRVRVGVGGEFLVGHGA
jgi:hypothetical protein